MSACWNWIIGTLSLHMTKPSLSALSYHIQPQGCQNKTKIYICIMHSMPSRPLSSVRAVILFKWTPHIHLTIIRCVLSKLAISSTFIVQVSLACPKTLWKQALYTFPYTLREAPLDVNTGASSLNFAQARRTLALDASFAPPPAPIKSLITELVYAFQIIKQNNHYLHGSNFSNSCPSTHILHRKPAAFYSLPDTPLHLSWIHWLHWLHWIVFE